MSRRKRTKSRRAKPARAGAGFWVILVSVLASGMVFIDATALGVAIPALQRGLGANGPQVLWVQNAYAVALTALLLWGGALGDRHGRKRVFAWGVIVFALASALAGAAANPAQLIFARVLQGCGGALLLPGALGLIVSHVPAGHQGRAIAQWSALSALATVAGPVLGGILTQAGWWRAVFWINLPVAVVLLAFLAAKVPPEKRHVETAPLDVAESFQAAAGLGLVSWGLIEGSRRGWADVMVWVTMAGGMLWLGWMGYGLWVRQQGAARERAAERVPLGKLGWAAGITLLVYTPFYALQLFLPLNLIQAHGFRADVAGLAQLPLMAGLISLSPQAGRMVDRHGPWRPLVVGTGLTAAGFVALMLPGSRTYSAAYWWTWFPALLMLGCGLAFCITPLTSAIMNGVRSARVSLAAAFNSLLSRVASLLAFGVMAPLVMMVFIQTFTLQVGPLEITEAEFQAIRATAIDLGNARPPEGLATDQAVQVVQVVKQSFMSSFRVLCGMGALLAGVGAVLAGRRVADRGR